MTHSAEREAQAIVELAAEMVKTLTETNASHFQLQPSRTIGALLMIVAAIVESSPGSPTYRDLHKKAKAAALNIESWAKYMRASFEETGRHGLEQIAEVRFTFG